MKRTTFPHPVGGLILLLATPLAAQTPCLDLCEQIARNCTGHNCSQIYDTCSNRCANTPDPGPMLFDGTVTPVYEQTVQLPANIWTRFEARNLTPGAQPVLHLLNSAGAEVASSPPGSTLLRFRSPSAGAFVLVVRAGNASTAGTGDLYRNGELLASQIRFAGWSVTFERLQPGEEIETVQLPNGPPNPRLYVLQPGTRQITRRVAGGGTAGAALYSVASAGSTTFIVGSPSTAGPGRIFRNDARLPNHDLDGDGLGFYLESFIGICSDRTGVVRGFDCSRIGDARDTDGDGLNDAWELRGRRDVTPHQPLPLWGADPRHKDIFYEVDFMLRAPGEIPMKMSPAEAHAFAAYYQDEIGVLTTADKAAHAASLRNPDGLPGIHIHLDTGVPPQSSGDATLYGDWGGYNAIPSVQNQNGDPVGVDYTTAWQTNMVPARFGVFRYMLPYATGEGSNGPGYACASGLSNIPALAHECAHASGLGPPRGYHSLEPPGSPDTNCKPNHPSIMNYAYSYSGVGFADGRGRPPLNNAGLVEWQAVNPADTTYIAQLRNIFGYRVDPAGHVDWDRNGYFEPAGRRVRAYANYQPGGSCEYTRYNQSRVGDLLSERTPALARLGNRLYAFAIDSAAPNTVKYRSSTSDWSCLSPSDQCGTWSGGGLLAFGARVTGIDAARLGNDLVLAAITADGRLWERELSVPPSGSETWSPLRPVAAEAAGEPALESDGSRLLLVYKAADLTIRYSTRYSDQPWSPAQTVLSPDGVSIATSPDASPGIGFGSLQLQPPPQPATAGLYGAFADSNGRLDLWYFEVPSNQWQKTAMFVRRPGPITARPALAYAPHMTCCDSGGRWITSSTGGTFYVIYSRKSDGIARMMMSYQSQLPAGQKVGLDADYDNPWWAAHGLDLLPDYNQSGSLFALATFYTGNPETNKQLWIRPRSDGILNYEYSNKDDWAIMGGQLCRLLRTPLGSLAPLPHISCP